MVYASIHIAAIPIKVAHPPAANGLDSIPVNIIIKYAVKPIIIEDSAARGVAFFLLIIAYIIGPNVPAETPEIPIHIKSPKKGGGFKTNNEARTPTTITATRLIINAILSTFSSSTLIIPRFTKTFLNISLAKTVDITTNKPSVVDNAAAKITTATNAANKAGNPQVTYSNNAISAFSIPGTAIRA